MKIRKLSVCSFICLAIVLLAGAAALADTIKLKDGSVLKGKVISYNQRKFTILVNIGGSASQHVVPVEEVESVEFDSSDVTSSSRVEPLGANPPSYPAETQPTRTAPPAAAPERTVSDAEVAAIAEKNVSVAAAADWTSTEIRVQKGQRIVISASGEIDLGDNQRCGPDGLPIADNRKLIAPRPTGALIAVVGDDNDDFIFVGKATEFISPHNGILFLSVNEGNLKDNAGAFVARVKVLSNR